MCALLLSEAWRKVWYSMPALQAGNYSYEKDYACGPKNRFAPYMFPF